MFKSRFLALVTGRTYLQLASLLTYIDIITSNKCLHYSYLVHCMYASADKANYKSHIKLDVSLQEVRVPLGTTKRHEPLRPSPTACCGSVSLGHGQGDNLRFWAA